MDWDKIRIFHAVAKAGSFTSAGDKLNLSQSAISRQISQLEESLGTVLFHRHARGLILTEQGEILQKSAEDILLKISTLESKLADTKAQPEGSLTLTVSNIIGSTWIAPRVRKFTDAYPDIQLTLLYDDRILNLGMREADAAIRLQKPEQPELIPRLLRDITFYICASKEYLDANGRPKSPQDLKNHRLIGWPPDSPSPIQYPNWIYEFAGIDPEKDMKLLMINSIYGTFKAVQHHAGIAVLPDYLIEWDDNIEVIMPDFHPPPIGLYFVYSEELRNSRRIQALRDFLLETVNSA